jgi:dTDP-4-amino-4,6-dideoxygalactose transaminase
LDVKPGDEVIVPTLTFVASANAVSYVGATPVFVDSSPSTWNIDTALLADLLEDRARRGTTPKALIAVDLYGQCADYEPLEKICTDSGVAMVEDAAEALGATYQGQSAGTFGQVGVFSFNGNKIITTSGGGMLVTDNGDWARRARHLATQAREAAVHYEHREIGFNYRMSNLLAALGRGQLRGLEAKVARRREICSRYRHELESVPGISFMPEASYGTSSRWLTVALVDAESFGSTRDDLIALLERENIEARPAWKPMHMQPVYQAAECYGGAVAAAIFAQGICLPSGSSLSENDQTRVIERLRSAESR